MFVNSDFSDLLRLFNANSVEYLVIGGYALIEEPRSKLRGMFCLAAVLRIDREEFCLI